ncbi:MAG: 50S ribosomal protein L6 [Candidatus Aenigmatarchaeota archaeon]|nr:MAG: 50S ribosomal protein L6 [Candidatus Aenigmarchaeota archaeon]
MEKIVEIPEGVNIRYEKNILTVTGPKGELNREFVHPHVELKTEGGKAIVSSKDERRKNKAVVGTWAAHIKNMIIGVQKGWEAKLKLVYSHFPIKISVEGNKVKISNFLGERNSRFAQILDNTKVEIKGSEIIITGIDKEKVGQTAANIELTAKVKGFDKRVFQDGCHLVQKTQPVEG